MKMPICYIWSDNLNTVMNEFNSFVCSLDPVFYTINNNYTFPGFSNFIPSSNQFSYPVSGSATVDVSEFSLKYTNTITISSFNISQDASLSSFNLIDYINTVLTDVNNNLPLAQSVSLATLSSVHFTPGAGSVWMYGDIANKYTTNSKTINLNYIGNIDKDGSLIGIQHCKFYPFCRRITAKIYNNSKQITTKVTSDYRKFNYFDQQLKVIQLKPNMLSKSIENNTILSGIYNYSKNNISYKPNTKTTYYDFYQYNTNNLMSSWYNGLSFNSQFPSYLNHYEYNDKFDLFSKYDWTYNQFNNFEETAETTLYNCVYRNTLFDNHLIRSKIPTLKSNPDFEFKKNTYHYLPVNIIAELNHFDANLMTICTKQSNSSDTLNSNSYQYYTFAKDSNPTSGIYSNQLTSLDVSFDNYSGGYIRLIINDKTNSIISGYYNIPRWKGQKYTYISGILTALK